MRTTGARIPKIGDGCRCFHSSRPMLLPRPRPLPLVTSAIGIAIQVWMRNRALLGRLFPSSRGTTPHAFLPNTNQTARRSPILRTLLSLTLSLMLATSALAASAADSSAIAGSHSASVGGLTPSAPLESPSLLERAATGARNVAAQRTRTQAGEDRTLALVGMGVGVAIAVLGLTEDNGGGGKILAGALVAGAGAFFYFRASPNPNRVPSISFDRHGGVRVTKRWSF